MDPRLTAQYLVTEAPLYAEVPLEENKETVEFLVNLETTQQAINAFCVDCAAESVFHIAWSDNDVKAKKDEFMKADVGLSTIGMFPGFKERMPKGKIEAYYAPKHVFTVTAYCMRNTGHTISAIFMIKDRSIQKIGQYPSYADLSGNETRKYQTIMEDYAELSRAVGLASVNVGIGAFVYLRRIIERLLEESHASKAKEAGWNEQDYQKGRVSDRIKMLGDALPRFFSENSDIYAILSKGIHELSESECLKYFPVLRVAIKLVLDEKIEKRTRERKVKEASDAIKRAKGEIRSTGET